MAHDADFHVTVTGRGGHASAPHACVDPVVCASAIVMALQTIVSRTLLSDGNAVVSVTMLRAGEATNVIPDAATLAGTIRDLDPAAFAATRDRMRAIVEGTAASYGYTGRLDIAEGYCETANDAVGFAAVARAAAREPLPLKVVDEGLPLMGSEDFDYYLKRRLGCFFIFGTR